MGDLGMIRTISLLSDGTFANHAIVVPDWSDPAQGDQTKTTALEQTDSHGGSKISQKEFVGSYKIAAMLAVIALLGLFKIGQPVGLWLLIGASSLALYMWRKYR